MVFVFFVVFFSARRRRKNRDDSASEDWRQDAPGPVWRWRRGGLGGRVRPEEEAAKEDLVFFFASGSDGELDDDAEPAPRRCSFCSPQTAAAAAEASPSLIPLSSFFYFL